MKKNVLLVLVLFACSISCGCMTGIKEVVGGVRGAKSPHLSIKPAVSDSTDKYPLAGYTSFELGRFSDEIGGKVPLNLMPIFRQEFVVQLAENGLGSPRAGKTLIVRGSILHYESSSTMSMVLGPLEEVVVRTELVDKDTGKVLAVANCLGRSTTRINRGVKKKAQGLAKSIAGWIADMHHGEDE